MRPCVFFVVLCSLHLLFCRWVLFAIVVPLCVVVRLCCCAVVDVLCRCCLSRFPLFVVVLFAVGWSVPLLFVMVASVCRCVGCCLPLCVVRRCVLFAAVLLAAYCSPLRCLPVCWLPLSWLPLCQGCPCVARSCVTRPCFVWHCCFGVVLFALALLSADGKDERKQGVGRKGRLGRKELGRP